MPLIGIETGHTEPSTTTGTVTSAEDGDPIAGANYKIPEVMFSQPQILMVSISYLCQEMTQFWNFH